MELSDIALLPTARKVLKFMHKNSHIRIISMLNTANNLQFCLYNKFTQRKLMVSTKRQHYKEQITLAKNTERLISQRAFNGLLKENLIQEETPGMYALTLFAKDVLKDT